MRFLSNITFLIAVLAAAAALRWKDPHSAAAAAGRSSRSRARRRWSARRQRRKGPTCISTRPPPTGGRAPYNVQCDPGSSSIFAIGETAVRCTATDADMAQASCGFGVTVRVSQTIAKTKFMAFGDSITRRCRVAGSADHARPARYLPVQARADAARTVSVTADRRRE